MLTKKDILRAEFLANGDVLKIGWSNVRNNIVIDWEGDSHTFRNKYEAFDYFCKLNNID